MDRTGCPSVERLDRFLAGGLPAEDTDRVSAHLEDCGRCQSAVDELLADDSLLTWRRTAAARSEPGPPAAFLDSLRRMAVLVAGASDSRVSLPAEAEDGPRPEPEPCPDRIGGYEVLGVLGRGGMSVVYKARQPGLGRVVAVKRLSPRGPNRPDAARFLREAAAVARMHHPNIVQVYEVGEDAGRPFLVLEYVPGGTLAEYLHGAPADPRLAAGLLEQVARAVHHAHERGIVHRDLKPSNILLQVVSGQWSVVSEDKKPGSSLTTDHYPPTTPTPKVSDFGLARAVTEDQSLTLPDMLVGTPAYLAPEQVRHPDRPTPAADVYALGVVLYECLTGRPPLVGPTAMATLRLLDTTDPVPPTRLQPHLPRDLDTVCMACLRKDPRRRYPSALALADDLRRFLDGRPIRARRVGRAEAAWLWCRRNLVVAGLGVALAASVAAGLVVALVLLGEARRAEAEATANARHAGENEARALQSASAAAASARLANDRAYASDVQFANQMWVNRQYPVLHDLLDGLRPDRTDGVERRGFEWYHLWALAHPPHRTVPLRGQGWDVAAGRDGRLLAVAAGEAGVELFDAAGKSLRTLPGGGAKVMRVAVSADGKRVAGGSEDGTARVWEADTGRLVRTLGGHRGPVFGVSFHPDGRLVTAGFDGTVRLWDVDDPAAAPRVLRVQGVRFNCAAVSPDGTRLAAGGSDATIRVWEMATGDEQATLRGHAGDVLGVAFSPDSATLASGSRDRTVRLWDVASGKPVRLLPVHLDAVFAVAFAADGRSLASASLDRSVVITDAKSGLEVATLIGHADFAVGVAFAADGRTLASASWDHTIRLWDLTADRPRRVWRGHAQTVRAAAFAPDGTLATGAADGTLRLWDAAAGAERRVLGGHPGGVVALAFAPDGRLATAAGDRQIRVWDPAAGTVVRTLTGHTERVNGLAFGARGALLVGAGEGGSVYVWDADRDWAGRVLAKLPAAVTCVGVDPAGATVAAGCKDGTVVILDAATGRVVRRLEGHTGGVTAVDFGAAGTRLAVGSADRAVRVWEPGTGRLVHTLRGHVRGVTGVGFSPDGTRVFSGSQDGTVRVWHADSGQPLVTLSESEEVTALAVAPDGRAVAAARSSGVVDVRRANPTPGP
jgi:WD40 repeat protein